MKIDSVTSQNNNSFRKNFFINYSNKFMSFANSEKSPIEKTIELSKIYKEDSKEKGLETLTIFPKEVKDGKTIITA